MSILSHSTMKPHYNLRRLALVFLISGLSYLGSADDNQFLRDAIDNPNRLNIDQARDFNRKPFEVMKFFGVRPGMHIIDVFSGGGYYSELLSYAVGDGGTIIAHNNEAYLKYVSKTIKKRYINNRLPNIQRVTAEANQLNFAQNQADMVFLILAYHDIYYVPDSKEWPPIDRELFLSKLYSALKPGGTFAIIDHEALPQSDSTTGHQLHRIAKDLVKREVRSAGFILDSEAYFLTNESDDLTRHMYAPEIRGKTSRFILKFLKPLNFEASIEEEKLIP